MTAERSSFSAATRTALRQKLLAWYRSRRRDLPWRATRDPYSIWVSEIMLQQTQVATATPYYLEFIGRFPTVDHLAAAGESEVLEYWAGLGYYRRARHLHAAAREVVRDHGGRVPDEPEAFGRLPGVGRYTTGAVLSIAFGKPLPVLDGNVARVLARWLARPLAVREPKDARELWAHAEALVPSQAPGDWNQAMMELGATVCTPRAPRCGECPVSSLCRAHALGKEEDFPPVVKRRATEQVRRAVVLVERRGRVLMTQREGKLLAGLWEPPGVELESGADAKSTLAKELRRIGVRAKLTPTDNVIRHTITHRKIEVEVWRGDATVPVKATTKLRFVDPNDPDVAVTALSRKLASVAADEPKAG